VLDAWSPSDALRIVRESMDATGLPLFVSSLYAARPPAWAFAIGAACEAGNGHSLQQGDRLQAVFMEGARADASCDRLNDPPDRTMRHCASGVWK
jgi:hypothetical protein